MKSKSFAKLKWPNIDLAEILKFRLMYMTRMKIFTKELTRFWLLLVKFKAIAEECQLVSIVAWFSNHHDEPKAVLQ